MTSILIDYKNILSDDSNLIKNISKPPQDAKNFFPGLIVINDNDILEELSNLEYGEKRIEFINSARFIENILDYYYIMYNKERQICILSSNCEKYLPSILKSLFSGLDPKTLLWVNIELDEPNFSNIVDNFISNGFNSPYITTLNPLYSDIEPSIVLLKENIPSDNENSNTTLNKVVYAMEQYKNDNSCYLNAQLTANAINFLKEASKSGYTLNEDGKETQKEITGELFVKDVLKAENKEFIYLIDVDTKSVQSGEEENVNVSPTRYNFHSHPHEAYIRHSVDKAWPSVSDYLGYHKLGKNTIFHCVATLEGIYIMSFSAFWGNKLKKVSTKFIDKHFHIDHEKPFTPEEYVEKVNSILYKKHPIFEVKFFTWDKSDTIFKVFFPQEGSSCLTSQHLVEKYKKIYE